MSLEIKLILKNYCYIVFKCFYFNTYIHDISSFRRLLKLDEDKSRLNRVYLYIKSENESKNSHKNFERKLSLYVIFYLITLWLKLFNKSVFDSTNETLLIFYKWNLLPVPAKALFDRLWCIFKHWFILLFRVGHLCRIQSILELWQNNGTLIRQLTFSDILHKVNSNITHRWA